MSERDGFLRCILENPADDVARLVFADWLDEHGEEERAEFIRVQVELATLADVEKPVFASPVFADEMDEVADYCERWSRKKRLLERQRKVLAWRNIEAWATHRYVLRHTAGRAEFDQLHEDKVSAALFTRGFISHTTCAAADFLKYTEAIFSQHPVTQCRLTCRHPDDAGGERGMVYRYSGMSYWEPGYTGHNHPCHIPADIYSLMDGHIDEHGGQKFYESREKADAALLRACVAYGRQLSKLPPLPVTAPAV